MNGVQPIPALIPNAVAKRRKFGESWKWHPTNTSDGKEEPTMCRIRNCKRHEYDRGLCLTHLREALEAGVSYADASNWSPKDTRKKAKVDAVEVLTTDAPVELEERIESLND